MRKTIDKKIMKLLEYRIIQEEFSSRLYLSMGNYLANKGFKSAKTYFKYSEEEAGHATKVREYLLALGLCPPTPAIDEVVCDYKDFPDILVKTLDHEAEITRQCEELASACLESKDMLTFGLAMWFVNEQVEELDKAQTAVDMITTFGTSPEALMLIDNRISK